MAQQDSHISQRQYLFAVIESSLKTMITIYKTALETIKEKQMIIEHIKGELDNAKKEIEKFKQISKESANMSASMSSSLSYAVRSWPLQRLHSRNVSHETEPPTNSSPPGKQYIDPN
jgi:hypothetical protein